MTSKYYKSILIIYFHLCIISFTENRRDTAMLIKMSGSLIIIV